MPPCAAVSKFTNCFVSFPSDVSDREFKSPTPSSEGLSGPSPPTSTSVSAGAAGRLPVILAPAPPAFSAPPDAAAGSARGIAVAAATAIAAAAAAAAAICEPSADATAATAAPFFGVVFPTLVWPLAGVLAGRPTFLARAGIPEEEAAVSRPV